MALGRAVPGRGSMEWEDREIIPMVPSVFSAAALLLHTTPPGRDYGNFFPLFANFVFSPFERTKSQTTERTPPAAFFPSSAAFVFSSSRQGLKAKQRKEHQHTWRAAKAAVKITAGDKVLHRARRVYRGLAVQYCAAQQRAVAEPAGAKGQCMWRPVRVVVWAEAA